MAIVLQDLSFLISIKNLLCSPFWYSTENPNLNLFNMQAEFNTKLSEIKRTKNEAFSLINDKGQERQQQLPLPQSYLLYFIVTRTKQNDDKQRKCSCDYTNLREGMKNLFGISPFRSPATLVGQLGQCPEKQYKQI